MIIAGPTGSGKTGIACQLGQTHEVISFDSRQIYREMDTGTAKPTPEEQSMIRHHLIDIINPDEKINAAAFCRLAEEKIEEIRERGKTPLIVCGTGFYLKAFLYGMFPVPQITPETEREVEELSPEKRVQKLELLDPAAMEKLSPNDDYRISRALAINLSGVKWSSLKPDENAGYLRTKPDIMAIFLNPDRTILYERINRRALQMIKDGIIDETERLKNKYGSDCEGLKTIGYNFALEILTGKINLETFSDKLAQSHRNYAKKQITWFRSEKILEPVTPEKALDKIKKI